MSVKQVLCWHLISCRSAYKVSISYALNKILAALRPEVRNDKVNVEDVSANIIFSPPFKAHDLVYFCGHS